MKLATWTEVRSWMTSCCTKGFILINIANGFTLICQILYDITGWTGFCFERDSERILRLIKIRYFTHLLNFPQMQKWGVMALMLYLSFWLHIVDVFLVYVWRNMLRFSFNCRLIMRDLQWGDKLRGFVEVQKRDNTSPKLGQWEYKERQRKVSRNI